ncbi:MAG: DUF2029 domain-containing protein [Candidatus Riflebacteria bacterium]|nr:DUF2029 domain-containing protein [Candidatus Riflebacteria bacterium]
MSHLHGDLYVYYKASRELLGGGDPYYAEAPQLLFGPLYLYPPFFAFLLTPICLLDPAPCGAIWAVVLGAGWFWGQALIRTLQGRDGAPLSFLDVLPALLLLRPLWNGWSQGQVTLMLLPLLLLSLVRYRRGCVVSSAFLLAFAGSIKIFPLFLGIIFLGPGRRVGLVWLCLFCLILGALPALEVGPGRFVDLVSNGFLGTAAKAIESRQFHPANCSPLPTACRLVGLGSTSVIKELLLLSILVITAVLLWIRPAADGGHRETLWLALVWTSMIVVCPILWNQYLALLLFPLSVVLQHACRPRWDLVRCGLVGFFIVAAALFDSNSTTLLGKELAAANDGRGLPALGVLIFWSGLLFSFVMSHREQTGKIGDGSDPGAVGRVQP